ncbi:MAG: AAA family ATPase [Candidatus Eisenbacteria bacterium]
MCAPRVFNPDDYLETGAGRVFTPERNAAAWERVYAELESCFSAAAPETRFYLVMGVQGSGKTTWIHENAASLGPAAVCLDAALPARRHRTRALELAARFGVPAVAVWIKATLEEALARNLRRAPDQQVPGDAIRSVASLIEAPVPDEGFAQVLEISSGTSFTPATSTGAASS